MNTRQKCRWIDSGMPHIMPTVNDPLPPLNQTKFEKMAHGNDKALLELADEYSSETRSLMAEWHKLIDAGDFDRLREELHRCKGGAALFGLDRLAEFFGQCESGSHLETHGLDMTALETELAAAEKAVDAQRTTP
jgi:HPt (histidine-containing phosphotransfer) domain-containing protein